MKKPKISQAEAESIYAAIEEEAIVPTERMSRGVTLEQYRLETVEKMTQQTDLAVATLTEIMADENAKNPDRIKAAKIVLEYAIGRPREANFVDDAAYNKKANVGRIIIEGQVTPEAVRETIESNFYPGDERHDS